MEAMKWLELFAGAGGAALGIRRAGGQAVACVELDEAACASLAAANFPAVQADLNEWSHTGGPVDCLWSSFPCQAWSTAGKRLGAADSRNGWPSTLRIVDETRPLWVVLENVRGLVQHAGECDGYSPNPDDCPACYFQRHIVEQLCVRFAAVSWNVIDAADYGLPQHRRRVFVVAGPRRIRWPQPTHCAPGMAGARLFGEPLLPWATFGAALRLSADQSVIGGRGNPREAGATDHRYYRDLTGEPSTTVAAVQIRNAGPFVIDGGRNSAANPMQERPRPDNEPAPTVGGGGNMMIAVRRSQTNKDLPLRERPLDVVNDQPAPAILATYGKVTRGGSARGGMPFLIAVGPDIYGASGWGGRRRLTTAECATLQGFPHGHKFHGSQVQQYRQIGNAVPPRMAELLARAIHAAQKDGGRQ